MIVDLHTHIFPPLIAAERDRYLAADETFRLLYEDPGAKLATTDDLLHSMDTAQIDASVALGFAWRDPGACRLHNDYLLEASTRSNGRILAFCTLPLTAGAEAIDAEMRRCAAAGARGVGELRPENLGFDLAGEAGERMAAAAAELGLPLLFHVSEPVGHAYAGKEGLSLGAFYRFVSAHPGVTVIGAHWGGGLPLFASMPEVRRAFEGPLYVDTAASSLLYDADIYAHGTGMAGTERVLFGSDFPLLGQARSRRRIEESGLNEAARTLVLGGNAARLLGLT